MGAAGRAAGRGAAPGWTGGERGPPRREGAPGEAREGPASPLGGRPGDRRRPSPPLPRPAPPETPSPPLQLQTSSWALERRPAGLSHRPEPWEAGRGLPGSRDFVGRARPGGDPGWPPRSPERLRGAQPEGLALRASLFAGLLGARAEPPSAGRGLPRGQRFWEKHSLEPKPAQETDATRVVLFLRKAHGYAERRASFSPFFESHSFLAANSFPKTPGLRRPRAAAPQRRLVDTGGSGPPSVEELRGTETPCSHRGGPSEGERVGSLLPDRLGHQRGPWPRTPGIRRPVLREIRPSRSWCPKPLASFFPAPPTPSNSFSPAGPFCACRRLSRVLAGFLGAPYVQRRALPEQPSPHAPTRPEASSSWRRNVRPE
ncbi:proline-rich protein HaeIII subfamily 1-like [Sorex fumeus]|uniref:proline-rich protein HaeIII subfamily 1-like n=1 Tax=Sorex fumeus TaxID=62283 RepID=UPI0024AD7431|nr:proline-rich protein HaeIII subfamily 1-like [Sorex fumeus]